MPGERAHSTHWMGGWVSPREKFCTAENHTRTIQPIDYHLPTSVRQAPVIISTGFVSEIYWALNIYIYIYIHLSYTFTTFWKLALTLVRGPPNISNFWLFHEVFSLTLPLEWWKEEISIFYYTSSLLWKPQILQYTESFKTLIIMNVTDSTSKGSEYHESSWGLTVACT
jgi:hypothetical protein